MSTQKEFADFILDQYHNEHLWYRAMFGEYALYYDKKVVGLICNDTLYLKITPANQILLADNETGPAYPKAKPSYLISESQLEDSDFLNEVTLNVFNDLK